jgi:hypothetical protein
MTVNRKTNIMRIAADLEMLILIKLEEKLLPD